MERDVVVRQCQVKRRASHEPLASYKPDRNRVLPVLDLEFLEQREHIAGIAENDELRALQVQVVIDG